MCLCIFVCVYLLVLDVCGKTNYMLGNGCSRKRKIVNEKKRTANFLLMTRDPSHVTTCLRKVIHFRHICNHLFFQYVLMLHVFLICIFIITYANYKRPIHAEWRK